jgi:hypothetical protein
MPAALLALLCLTACASGPGAVGRPSGVVPTTTAAFCSEAQALIVGSGIPAQNIVHGNYDAFVKSKPVARPLQTHQYVWFEEGSTSQPLRVSCKMKTLDHLRAEYGAGAATADIGCAGVNRDTLGRVLESLTGTERRRLRFKAGAQVVFEPDEVTTEGPKWLEPHDFAYTDAAERLHLVSRSMQNDWLDPRYANSPPQFKGTRYCHLVAPEHLKRILMGDVAVPALPDR